MCLGVLTIHKMFHQRKWKGWLIWSNNQPSAGRQQIDGADISVSWSGKANYDSQHIGEGVKLVNLHLDVGARHDNDTTTVPKWDRAVSPLTSSSAHVDAVAFVLMKTRLPLPAARFYCMCYNEASAHFHTRCVNMCWIHEERNSVVIVSALISGQLRFQYNRETAQLVKWNLLFIWTTRPLNYFLCCQTTILDFDPFCLEQNRRIFWEMPDKKSICLMLYFMFYPSGQVKQI